MKIPSKFPHVIKIGSVSVTIYKQIQPAAGALFVISYYEGPLRKREARRSYQDAYKRAVEIATAINAGEANAIRITGEDQVVYSRALKALEPLKVPLDMAAQQVAVNTEKLRGHSINEAVEFFLAQNPVGIVTKTVTEVKDEFIAAAQADGATAIYVKDLKWRLGAFCKNFQCSISSITAPMIDDWLRGLKNADGQPATGRNRNNYRTSIRTLWRFAVARGYAAERAVDWDRIAVAKEAHAQIEIFTPAELLKLIEACKHDPAGLTNGLNQRYLNGPGLLPLVVFGAFAGLRTSEIEAQLWEDVLLDRGFIRVTKAKGNTPQKRLVPILPNLRAWLETIKQERGLVCSYGNLETAITRLAERAKVPWKTNALRHSFISYRVAETQDVGKVALEAGNSPQMIFRRYREVVTPEEAKTWFSLQPKAPDNIALMPSEHVA